MNEFVVRGIDIEDGSTVELASFGSSVEARDFLQRYVRQEDAGGWDQIVVEDDRGETSEVLWRWEREEVS